MCVGSKSIVYYRLFIGVMCIEVVVYFDAFYKNVLISPKNNEILLLPKSFINNYNSP